jgi:hypothetical protein
VKFLDLLRWAIANKDLILELIKLFQGLSPAQQETLGVLAVSVAETVVEAEQKAE